MTTKAERARLVCQKIAADVGAVAPAGLGHWPRAWVIVEEPSKAFLDTLDTWVQAPANGPDEMELRRAVAAAGTRVTDAWKAAAREYQSSSQPREASYA